MSCTGIRKCLKQQIDLLNELWAQIKPHMDNPSQKQYSQIISWCNFYENRKFKLDIPINKKWLQWAEKLTQQVCPENQIICAGFVRNPPRSTKNQTWHLDYGLTSIIMIPMVDQTCENATQLIQQPLRQQPQRSPLGYDTHFGDNVLDILEKENLQFMKVTQLVCKAHTILKINPGVVHRGIANRSDEQRVLLAINCSPTYFQLNQQPLVSSNFTDEEKKGRQNLIG